MNDKKLGEKIKEGVSVQELESLARKYTTEVFLILSIFVASISSIFNFFTAAGWSIAFAGLGAIVSLAIPEAIMNFHKKLLKFFFKQEKVIQITIGVVRIVVGLFVPFIIFAEMGLLAGSAFHFFSKQIHGETPPTEKK
jgi:hypothetical protein